MDLKRPDKTHWFLKKTNELKKHKREYCQFNLRLIKTERLLLNIRDFRIFC